MNEPNQLHLVSTLSASEFKQYKKSLRVLTGSGIGFSIANDILLSAIETKRISQLENRQNRVR